MEARTKPATIKYDRPSSAPYSPNGPAGKPQPVVFSVHKLHHMIGWAARPKTAWLVAGLNASSDTGVLARGRGRGGVCGATSSAEASTTRSRALKERTNMAIGRRLGGYNNNGGFTSAAATCDPTDG